MDKVSFVTCPACKGVFYLERSDYAGKPNAPCQCPFCQHPFQAFEGDPRPPLVAPGAGQGAAAH